MTKLEIAVTTFADAQEAEAGGADSIEISENLAAGGLTPAHDLIERILGAVSIPTHVIVRPHDRDFIYTPDEAALILEQTRRISRLPVASIVFGAQQPNGQLDLDLIRRVREAAGDKPLTLHRALDSSVQPETALESLIGVLPRVLTSGPAANAWEGRHGLARWVSAYGQHFSFVASGGLKLEHLAEYTALVSAQEYHFGSAARTDDRADRRKVQQLRAILDQKDSHE